MPTVLTVLWYPDIKHPQSWRMTTETLQTSERTWHNEELNMNACINRCFIPHYYGNVKKIHILFIPKIPQQVGIYHNEKKKLINAKQFQDDINVDELSNLED